MNKDKVTYEDDAIIVDKKKNYRLRGKKPDWFYYGKN